MSGQVRTTFRQRVSSNSLIRNIADELIDDCAKLEIAVDYNAALLAVHLFSLDPKFGIDENVVVVNRKSMDALIRKCISIFSVAKSAFVQTLKMQVCFMDHVLDSNQIIGRHREQLLAKSQPLTRDIINSIVHSKHDDNKYFKKLATDIIVHLSLGNPTKVETIQETINALKSVMSKNDLVEFMALPVKEKLEGLIGLRGIVCGIRVFNRDAGHCGDGILDIKEVLQNGYIATKKQLSSSSNEMEDRIHLLTTSLNKHYSMGMNRPATAVTVSAQITPPFDADISKLKEALIMYRQHERFINELAGTLTELKLNIDKLLKAFREKLNDVHETVKYRIAISTEKIFPKFIDVAKLWEQLRNQLYVLSEINVVNEQLMALTFSAPEWATICDAISQIAMATETTIANGNYLQISNNAVRDYPVQDPNAGQKTTVGLSQAAAIMAADVELMKIVKYHNGMKTEYGGFCAWTLGECRGLLLLGDCLLNVITFRDKNYVFTSTDAFRRFLEHPERCLEKIVAVLREMPQLIIFFDMYDEMKANVIRPYRVENRQAASATSRSVEIQTETHPIPYNKDPNYTFSIWELRRQAIQLANLRASRTRSTQSDASVFRRNVTSQTYAIYNKGIQLPKISLE